MSGPEAPPLACASPDEWDAWLAEHHDSSSGIWLKIVKKAAGIDGVSHREAVDVALCHGWIDSRAQALDDDHWLQRFTPRRAQSKWSKINRERALELIEQGAMRPAGLREVERARADGRWDAA